MTGNDTETPVGLDAAEAARILTALSGETDLRARIDRISDYFLGRPYVEGSLGGGPDLAEELRVYLNAFDCVTLMETVLAFALARNISEFVDAIRRIRYEGGEVDWFHRNHYMVDWARNNEQHGFVKNLTKGPYASEKTSTLNLIAGLPEKIATFGYLSSQRLDDVAKLFETGDLILFVSIKDTLDVFHTGVLVEREGRWRLRHATRTAGAVIDQDLAEFVSRNEMAGLLLLRPLCRQ